MTAVIIIGIIILIIWTNSSRSSNSSNYSSGSTTKTETYTPTVYPRSNSQVSNSSSQTISVSPTKISSSPDLKISLIEGEYRYFENHYVNGRQYSFGFPKENCSDKRVWVGIGKVEIERISHSEAMRRIGNKKYLSNESKYLSLNSNDFGYCTVCNKKLRGDIYKKKCYECYTNGTTTNHKIGYCANCNKKLRGNIYKKHCTVCYHNGYR